ncbi:MAG: hypothetical protein U0002_06495 [Thermoanaerobaculia bacterium]
MKILRGVLAVLACITLALATDAVQAAPAKGQQALQGGPPGVCSGPRYIAKREAGQQDCPPWAGLHGEPLFEHWLNSLSAQNRKLAERLELDRFCVYQAPAAPTEARVPGPGDPGSPQDLFPARPGEDGPREGLFAAPPVLDRVALSAAAASELQPDNWQTLEHRFLGEGGELGSGVGVARLGHTRLAILDTQPTGDGVPAPGSYASRHGYSLAHMARSLLAGMYCQPGQRSGCGVEIATRLAMPLSSFDPTTQAVCVGDPVAEGGAFGRIGDLAEATLAELTDWLHGRRPGDRLVLSLSLGWDGEAFGGYEGRVEKMPAPVQAAFQALRFARKKGVLVVAAAGNRSAASSSSCRALLPAGWEFHRPKVSSALPGWLEGLLSRRRAPVAYAAGGVQGDGMPLANARACALPARVAFADHAVVAAPGEPGRTAVLTGSSVAALVVATASGAAWSEGLASRTPGRLMALVDGSGTELDYRSNLRRGISGSAGVVEPMVHQITVCSAVVAARPSLGTLACAPLELKASSGLAVCDPSFTVATLKEQKSSAALCLPGSCGDAPSTPCLATDPSCQAPLRPQPEGDPCVSCSLTGNPPPKTATLASLDLARASAASSLDSSEPACGRFKLHLNGSADLPPSGFELELERLQVVAGELQRTAEVYLLPAPVALSGGDYLLEVGVPASSLQGSRARLRYQVGSQRYESPLELW